MCLLNDGAVKVWAQSKVWGETQQSSSPRNRSVAQLRRALFFLAVLADLGTMQLCFSPALQGHRTQHLFSLFTMINAFIWDSEVCFFISLNPWYADSLQEIIKGANNHSLYSVLISVLHLKRAVTFGGPLDNKSGLGTWATIRTQAPQ